MGNKLKELREANKLTQDDLSTMIGLSRASIANIEAGKQSLTAILVYIISQTFSTTPSALFPYNNELVISIEPIEQYRERKIKNKIAALNKELEAIKNKDK